MRIVATTFLAIGCGLSCGSVTDPEANAVGGAYILAEVDGVALPAPGSSVPCPPAITGGELHQPLLANETFSSM
jgi:hypothetical protein